MRSLRLLLLVVLIFALQCVPVMAAAGDYDLTKAGEAYTLVYETADPVGTQVVLIMMAGSSLTDGKVPISASGDITYIDQTAVAADAGANKVTFSGFIPMETTEDFFSLYLGGLTDGPTWVATISASGVIVSGKVAYFGSGNMTINLYDSTKEIVIKSMTVTKGDNDADVSFAFPKVVPGTYFIKNSLKEYYVSEHKQISVLVDDLSVSDISYKVYAGDITKNSEINFYDLIDLLDDYGKTSGFSHEGSDLNQNGVVNFYDLAALLDGYGKKDQ